MNIGQIKDLAVETFKEWSEDKAPRLAAALSYYTVFSLAPLLLIIIAVAGLFLGGDNQQVQNQVISQLATFVGQDAANSIADLLQAADRPQLGSISGLLGLVALLFGAGALFIHLQDSLNTIWEVAPKPNRGIWAAVRERFFSFAMVLGAGFLLLASLVLTTALDAFSQFFPGTAGLWQGVNLVVSLLITWLLFALVFKVVPDVKITWRDVLLGAAITAVLFAVGRYLLSLYLANSSTASAYGAAGSLVLLLVWIYYSAQIIFLGAEFTQVYARRFGSQIMPDDNAMQLSEADRTEQGMPRKENLEAAARQREVGGSTAANTQQDNDNRDSTAVANTAGNLSRSTVARLAVFAGLLSFIESLRRKR
ncbi:MAG: YihY/virulence factor BrkB family protein [Oscillochloris sp.]|nr:YihY/virulence factor BrkB family protein [Oscillochloris sp.]